MSIKTQLESEIKQELEELEHVEMGSDVYRSSIDGVTKLYDRLIQVEENEKNRVNKEEIQEYERKLKEAQLKHEKQVEWANVGLTACKIIGGFGLTAWAFIESMKFEEDGHIHSTEGGKSVLRSLLRFRF